MATTATALADKNELILQAVQGNEASIRELLALQCKQLIALLCEVTGQHKAYLGQSKRKLTEQIIRAAALREGIKLEGRPCIPYPDPPPAPTREGPLPRKRAKLARLAPLANPPPGAGEFHGGGVVCRNAACRAAVRPEESFCRRCSCCICRKFDENKDPSLWVVCGDDSLDPGRGSGCGCSSHLECALGAQVAGVSGESGSPWKLDAGYSCLQCGSITNLFVSCKKQLEKAKEARRVDTVCQRLSLADRILNGTERHKDLHSVVTEAVHTLEKEVGQLDTAAVSASRSCVTRLKNDIWDQLTVCLGYALDMVYTQLQSPEKFPQCQPEGKVTGRPIEVQVKAVKSDSITVSWRTDDQVLEDMVSEFKIWICKVGELNFTAAPNCVFKSTERRAIAHYLDEGTDYVFKLVAFEDDKVIGLGEVTGSTPKANPPPPPQQKEEQEVKDSVVVPPQEPKLPEPVRSESAHGKEDEKMRDICEAARAVSSLQNWGKADGETISVEKDLQDDGGRGKERSPQVSEGEEQVGFGNSHGASSVTHSSGQLPVENPQVSSKEVETEKVEEKSQQLHQTVETARESDESVSASEGAKLKVMELEEVRSPGTTRVQQEDVQEPVQVENCIQPDGNAVERVQEEVSAVQQTCSTGVPVAEEADRQLEVAEGDKPPQGPDGSEQEKEIQTDSHQSEPEQKPTPMAVDKGAVEPVVIEQTDHAGAKQSTPETEGHHLQHVSPNPSAMETEGYKLQNGSSKAMNMRTEVHHPQHLEPTPSTTGTERQQLQHVSPKSTNMEAEGFKTYQDVSSKPSPMEIEGRQLQHVSCMQNVMESRGLRGSASAFELCVKVILSLERKSHLPSAFRKAFLTWLSRRASDREKEVVNVFIDTMSDQPEQLAEQLIDTFEELMTQKRPRFDSTGSGPDSGR